MAQLLSAAEVAKRLGVSVRTVHRKALAGELPTAGKLPGATGAFLFEDTAIDALTGPRV